MNNVKKTLVRLFLTLFIINIIFHNVYAQSNNTIELLKESALNLQNDSSEVTKEDILIEAQRSFDRSLSILNIVATLMGVLVTILAVVIAIVGGLGGLEIKRWHENRKRIEEEVAVTKKNVDFIESLRAKAEGDVNALRHEVESFPRSPLNEKPSSEVREILNEFGHRLETLEMLGVSLKPNDYISRGDDLYFKGKYVLALEAYEKALEFKPDDASIWDNKGITLGNLGRFDEALKAFDKAIEIKTDDASAWYNKGVMLGNLGRFDEALKVFDKAIDLKPEDSSAWYNKSVTLGNLGQFDEALKADERAIELEPDDVSYWDNKGIALGNLSRYDEALKAFDKAIELNPNIAEVWFNRAYVYFKKKEKENALSSFKRAIVIDKSYKEKAKNDKDFENFLNDADSRTELKRSRL